MLRLANSIHIFRNQEKLKIINYQEGVTIKINYSKLLVDILEYLKEVATIEEVYEKFSNISKDKIDEVLENFINLRVIENIKNIENHQLTCLIIGLGTTGSHIYRELRNLKLKQIILVDNDIVEEGNIHRQAYTKNDLGKFKVDVLSKDSGVIDRVITFKSKIETCSDLNKVIKKYQVDLIIDSADYPSTRELALLVEQCANYNRIPYIVNFGYVGNVVTLPEFYYPQDNYQFSTGHVVYGDELIFLNSFEKVPHRYARQAALVVAEQVTDYINNRIPVFYRKRGFFHAREFRWKTEEIFE